MAAATRRRRSSTSSPGSIPASSASCIIRQNRGYGGALRSGFATATKDLVFYTDGDAQYDPAEMRSLWERMTPEVDWVNGYKISRSDPAHRIVIGRVYHHIVKLLFGFKVRDVDCDFRLIRRRVFDVVRLEKEQRRHLPRDDEEVSRRQASASPKCRCIISIAPTGKLAVLQLSAHRSRPASMCFGLWWTPRDPQGSTSRRAGRPSSA